MKSKAKSCTWSLRFRDKQFIYITFNKLDREKGFRMSNLYKGLNAGMPRNRHLESKTPHCAFTMIICLLLNLILWLLSKIHLIWHESKWHRIPIIWKIFQNDFVLKKINSLYSLVLILVRLEIFHGSKRVPKE